MDLMIKNTRIFLVLFLVSGFRCQIQASGDGELLQSSDSAAVALSAQLLTDNVGKDATTTKAVPATANAAKNGLVGFGRQLALLSNYWQLHWRACAIKITKLLQDTLKSSEIARLAIKLPAEVLSINATSLKLEKISWVDTFPKLALIFDPIFGIRFNLTAEGLLFAGTANLSEVFGGPFYHGVGSWFDNFTVELSNVTFKFELAEDAAGGGNVVQPVKSAAVQGDRPVHVESLKFTVANKPNGYEENLDGLTKMAKTKFENYLNSVLEEKWRV